MITPPPPPPKKKKKKNAGSAVDTSFTFQGIEN